MKYIFLQQDIIFLLVIQLINKSFSQKNFTFNMEGHEQNSELEVLKARVDDFTNPLIPSLFYPIVLVKNGYSTNIKIKELDTDIVLKNLVITDDFTGELIQELENMHLYYAKGETNYVDFYFGLSFSNNGDLDNEYINLNELKKNNIIENKIFSFDKWEELDNNTINSSLYLGFNHNNFISDDGIVGFCDVLKNDSYWGCLFNELSINNKTILLKNETNYFYKIYFTSETYNIEFPIDFQPVFINSTDYKCYYEVDTSGEEYLFCDDYFGENDYFEMILRTSEMNITVEIDDAKRYSSNIKKNDKRQTRIKFSDKRQDLIILPLIMFKKFHVQFNRETNKIYFYTTDPDILQVVKKESKKDSSDSSGSSGLTIFLVILIIIIALGLGFGVFYFLKRKSKTENDINKFNKFEDEEDFKAMNEKRVF